MFQLPTTASQLIAAFSPIASEAGNILQSLSNSFGKGQEGAQAETGKDFTKALEQAANKPEKIRLVKHEKPKTAQEDSPQAAAVETKHEYAQDYQHGHGDKEIDSVETAAPAEHAAASDEPMDAETMAEVKEQIESALHRLDEMMDANGAELPADAKALMQMLQDMLKGMLQLMQAVAGANTNGAVNQDALADIAALGQTVDALQTKIKAAMQQWQQTGLLTTEPLEGGEENTLPASGLARLFGEDEAAEGKTEGGKLPLIALLNRIQNVSDRIDSLQGRIEQHIDKALLPKLNPQAANTPATEIISDGISETLAAALEAPPPVALKNERNEKPLESNAAVAPQATTSGSQNLTGAAVAASASAQQGRQQSTGSGSQGFGQSNSHAQSLSSITGAQPQQAGQAAKEPSSFDRMLNQTPRGSAAEQVAFQMKAQMKDGSSRFVVKLSPEELGEVEVRMQIGRDGKTGMVINVERPQTLELLQRDIRLLQQALSDAGLKADSGSLSFNLRDEQHHGGGEQRPTPQVYYPPLDDDFDEGMLQVASREYVSDVQHGLNIKV